MSGKILFVLGAGSDVGKTMMVAAILRLLKRKGFKVAPFKAQNMSNNSFVTAKGFCLSRAQAMQAEAAGVEIIPEMNPVLLKPSSAIGSEVIVMGRSVGVMAAKEYYKFKDTLKPVVVEALNTLAAKYDIVIVEGAGSCVEINLKQHDLVNLGLATAVKAPFLLVVDIDRGGVFAQAVGAKALMTSEEEALFKGIIVNKFRGDAELFESGRLMMEDLTKRQVLGVVPFMEGNLIEPEDSLSTQAEYYHQQALQADKINIAVLGGAYKGDLADVNALGKENDVILNFITDPKSLQHYDALLLPSFSDPLLSLSQIKRGWKKALNNHLRDGKAVWAVGTGLALLADKIFCSKESATGLGLYPEISLEKLDIAKTYKFYKEHFKVQGYMDWKINNIKLGSLTAFSSDLSSGGFYQNLKFWGSPLVGMFSQNSFRTLVLNQLRLDKNLKPKRFARDADKALRLKQYDLWADHVERYLSIDKILQIINS